MNRYLKKLLLIFPLLSATVVQATIDTDITNLTTSSHTLATSDTMIDRTIGMTWSAPVIGGGATLANYRYRFSTQSDATFSDVVAGTYLGSGNTSVASSTLTDSNTWYFYIVAVDSAGNWGTVQKDGPFIIDTAPEVQSVEDADGNRTGSNATAQTLTISGSKFMENISVSLGGTTLSQVTRNSSTAITATVPADFTPSSLMTVQVTNTAVSKSGSSQDSNSQYTVTAANNNPTITTITANGAASNASGEIDSGTGTASITLVVDATDSDGDSLSYSWSANADASGTFTGGSSSSSVTYTANVATTYTFTIAVDDNNGGSATQSIQVTINGAQNNTPTAEAGTAQNVVVGDFITLSGSATDLDASDTLFYTWTFDQIPSSSDATDTAFPSSNVSGNQTTGNTITVPSAFRTDVAGDYIVRLRVADGPDSSDSFSEDTVVITAAIGSLDSTKSLLVADTTDTTADGTSAVTVTVTPKDRNSNNLAAGQSVVISSTVGTVTGGSGTTDASGTFSATIASTTTGSGTVSATVGGSSVSTTESITFSPGSLSTSQSTLVVVPTIASASDTLTATVVPKDAQGNKLAGGQTVVISTTPVIDESGTVTESNGEYQQIFIMGAQDVSFSATVNSTTIDATDSVSYSATAPSGSLSTVTIDASDNLVANGTASRTITVTAKDSASAVLADKVVSLVSTDASDSIADATDTTDANGEATFTITSTRAGTKTYTATVFDNGDMVTINQTVQATFVAGTATTITASTGGGATGAVTTTLTAPFVATVTDAQGNAVSGETVNFSVTPNATGTLLSATSDTTSSSGDASTTLTLGQTSGTYTVTATLAGTDASTTFTATATPGAVDAGALGNTTVAVGADSSATATTYNLAVTEQVKIWITPKDSYGNLLGDNGLDVQVSGALNGGSLSSSRATYDATAKAYYVELSAPATSGATTNLTVIIGSVVGKSVAVTYVPGAVSASKTTVSADKSTIVVGATTAATITVVPKDLEGNLLGAGQTVKVTTTTGLLTGQSDATGTMDVQAVNDATDNTKYTVVLSGVDASDSGTANITVKVVSNGSDTLIDATDSVTISNWTLDVDLNGSVSAFKDGFLVVKSLLGFSDSSIESSIGSTPDASRDSAAEINAYIQSLIP